MLAYAGQGDAYAGEEAMYEAGIIASPAAPELVGVAASGQG